MMVAIINAAMQPHAPDEAKPTAREVPPPAAPPGLISPDGKWLWDGAAWKPVEPQELPRQRHRPFAFRTLAINLVSPVRPWIRSAAVGELASFRRGPPGYFGQGVVAVTLDQKVEGSNPSSPAKGFSRSSPRPDRLTTPNTRYG